MIGGGEELGASGWGDRIGGVADVALEVLVSTPRIDPSTLSAVARCSTARALKTEGLTHAGQFRLESRITFSF